MCFRIWEPVRLSANTARTIELSLLGRSPVQRRPAQLLNTMVVCTHLRVKRANDSASDRDRRRRSHATFATRRCWWRDSSTMSSPLDGLFSIGERFCRCPLTEATERPTTDAGMLTMSNSSPIRHCRRHAADGGWSRATRSALSPPRPPRAARRPAVTVVHQVGIARTVRDGRLPAPAPKATFDDVFCSICAWQSVVTS